MKENFYREILMKAPLGYAHHKLLTGRDNEPEDYLFLEVNKAFEHLTGLKQEEIVGKKASEVLPLIREGTFDWVDFYGKVALQGTTRNFIQYSQDIKAWFAVTAFASQPGYFVTLFQNITKEIEKRKELKAQNNRLNKISEELNIFFYSIKDAVFLVGIQGNEEFVYLRSNEAHQKLTGISIEELQGKTPYELVGEKLGEEITGKYKTCLIMKKETTYEEELILPAGRKVWETTLTPVIKGEKVLYLIGVSKDITTQKDAEKMYHYKMQQGKALTNNLISAFKSTFEKNMGKEEDTERVIKASLQVGKKLGLSVKERGYLELLALLHDIGKVAIKENIMLKLEPLEGDEWEEIKTHPEIGYRIAKSKPELAEIAEYILCHHERWDGKGYPRGLKGEEIPYIVRIFTVADAFVAMTSERTYRITKRTEEALQELKNNAGTQFDPRIVEAFIESINEEIAN